MVSILVDEGYGWTYGSADGGTGVPRGSSSCRSPQRCIGKYARARSCEYSFAFPKSHYPLHPELPRCWKSSLYHPSLSHTGHRRARSLRVRCLSISLQSIFAHNRQPYRGPSARIVILLGRELLGNNRESLKSGRDDLLACPQ